MTGGLPANSGDPDVIPSFAQCHRLEIDRRLTAEGRSSSDWVSFGVRVQESLRDDLVEAALRSVLDRHDVLRMYFPEFLTNDTGRLLGDGAALSLGRQCVHPSEAAVIEAVRRHTETTQTLADPPLVQATLVQDDRKGPSVLVVSVEHAVFDGTSIGHLVASFAEAYEALVHERSVEDLPPGPSFTAFAARQREWLATDVARQRLEELTANAPDDSPVALLSLPGRTVGAELLAGKTRVIKRDLGREGAAALSGICASLRVTAYMLFLGLLGDTVRTQTGTREFGVLTPAAGRAWREFRGGIGFYANLVPINLPTLRAEDDLYWSQVRSATGLGIKCEMVPFSYVKREKYPHIYGTRMVTPYVFFDCGASTDSNSFQLDGIEAQQIDAGESRWQRHDPGIDILVYHGPDQVSIHCAYPVAAYEADVCEVLLDDLCSRFETLALGSTAREAGNDAL